MASVSDHIPGPFEPLMAIQSMALGGESADVVGFVIVDGTNLLASATGYQ